MAVKFPTNKVALIIAFNNFRDEEFFVTKEAIESHGNKTAVISDTLGISHGADGADVWIDKTIDKIDITKYDAIVFIGGPGALKHLDNKDSYNIAQAATRAGIVVAAICIAPIILAKSGILKDKKATAWTSRLDKKATKILKEHGAIFTNEEVVTDNRVVTANSRKTAQDFGMAIVELLRP